MRLAAPAASGFRRRLRGPVILAIVLAGSACTPAERPADAAGRPTREPSEYQVVDDAGRVVRLDRPASRIVSLLPATTETLLALGAADRLVARTDYDEDPVLQHLPSVGGGLTPSVELLASLRPDLVIAWEEAGTARIRPRLEALGVPVFAVQTRDTAAIYANIQRLGRLTGLDRRADSLAAGLRRRLEDIGTSAAGLPRPSVVYLISVDPPIVAGPRVFIGEMVEIAGGRNVFSDVAAASPQVSLEEIVRRRPEVVLVPAGDDSAAVLSRLRTSPGWRGLLASGATRVGVLPVDILHRPGPSIAESAAVLRDVLHATGPAPLRRDARPGNEP